MLKLVTLSMAFVIVTGACGSGDQADSQAGESTPLLFGLGMHIEPLGTTAQGYRSSVGDYGNRVFFERQVEDILAVAAIVESHGGAMTVQAQSPFTTTAIKLEDPILADLAAAGHEIALHFHERAHLGREAESLAAEEWCSVMIEEIGYVQTASGVEYVRSWSGGNLYIDLFKAADCAGLDITSDWKNPQTQTTAVELMGVNPWRPSGGTDGSDVSNFAAHDGDAPVVFLPTGIYSTDDSAASNRSDSTGGDDAYFEFLEDSLMASIEAAQPGKVNVFSITVHPAEFAGDREMPFEVIERFLAKVIDPLVESGDVQWATFSDMADAFIDWEAANPNEDPRDSQYGQEVSTPGVLSRSRKT